VSAQHRLQRTEASPLADMRRAPAKVLVGEGVLPVPPLPLKPTVGRLTWPNNPFEHKEDPMEQILQDLITLTGSSEQDYQVLSEYADITQK
jgi:hypothetical protein